MATVLIIALIVVLPRALQVVMAKPKWGKHTHCYLCSKLLKEPVTPDHVPPKLFFPAELRKKYGMTDLLTIPVHHACNQMWRMDEEYFVHTLLPLARGSEAGDAAHAQTFKKYQGGRNVPLVNMVMDEFKHVVKGIHLPANRVAKMIDADRFHDALYKIIRGLHYHHSGEILPSIWSITYTVTPPYEDPPEEFKTFAQGRASMGKYPGIFASAFHKFTEVNNLHFWAFLLWDGVILTAAFHDPAFECDHCQFVGPRLPESMPGTIRV
ncbi:hypothetical protein IVA96_00395 [Bradyrhizobium sp. 159]|uniref:hypothetical protein n=1 Tax=unclassified Bradyrhizobium TaxID=2631580 RepID=UPI001FF8CBC7|nr:MULTISPECIES: hypothetical protein [unclassified Bradyrhizobium]MCK1597975.1 hypothetical protein [Bradyrhizobium sp. 164]MCK1615176.1 hypothetical protein [Bradyrhizobium sp. 159]MCK1666584.1 hypothetical protein [Bradyrhizobium sp. 153]